MPCGAGRPGRCAADRLRAGGRRVGPVVSCLRWRGACQVVVDAPAGARAGRAEIDASAGACAPLRVPAVRATVDGRPGPRRPGRRRDDGCGRVAGGRRGRAQVEEHPGMRQGSGLLVGHGQRRGPVQGAGAPGRRRTPVRRGTDAGRGRARVAARAPGRPVCDRGRESDAPEGRASRPAPGHGRGQEREGVRRLARRAPTGRGKRPTRSWRTRRTGRCASRTAPAKAAPNSPSWGAP